MTNTSFTAMQATVSMPFALKSAACWTKPGRWRASQVGVKAPGTENSTTFLPANSWSVVSFCGPSGPGVVNVPEGILSPALIVMVILLIGMYVVRSR